MTTSIELTPEMQDHLIHEEQMDIIKNIRECELTIGALLESSMIDSSRAAIFLAEAGIVRYKMWALQSQLELEYHTYDQSLEGTIDPWHDITPWSSVSDDMEIDGPEIHTQTSSYLMSESLQKARDTRKEMENDRTKADAPGEEAPNSYEGSSYDQRKSVHDLRVYCRPHPRTGDPLFLENIRILTNRGAAVTVDKNWTAPQEYVKYRREIYQPLGWKKVSEKLYTDIKIGHKTFKRRMVWHRSPELKSLHYMENKTPEQNARYRQLLQKFDELNKIERRIPIYKKYDEDGNEIKILLGHTTRKEEPLEYIKSGGINFNRSSQLGPFNGVEYGKDLRYSIKEDWAYSLKNAFIQRVQHGHVKECWHVSMDKNGKRVMKKQVYAVMRMVFSGTEYHVVVFSDAK